MTEFEDYLKLDPIQIKDQILKLLEGELDRAERKRFGSLMAMLLLQYRVAKRPRRKLEIKLQTFKSYKHVISTSVAIKSRNPQIVGFKYFLSGQPNLEAELSEFFQVVTFQITSAKKCSMRSVMEESCDVWRGPKTLKEAREATTVDKSFQNLLDNVSSLREDILKPVMDKIPAYTRTPATRAEFPLMFLGTVFNCCRQSDLTNADPSTLEVIDHEHLGRFVRCLVTETKTRQERFVDFYPVAGDFDPIVALDRLLRSTVPPKKAVTTSFTATQEHQLLRSNLVGTYDKFLAKTCPFPVFRIKNGPKSHFGRHLMASYLSKCNLGSLVTQLGNWSDCDDRIGIAFAKAKYGYHRKETPGYLYALLSGYYERVKAENSGDHRKELPSYLYAFLSGYYKLVKVKNSDDNYTCKLINPACKPVVVKEDVEAAEILERVYHDWKAIVKPEVLSFILRYSEAKRQVGPLEEKMLSKSTVVKRPCPP